MTKAVQISSLARAKVVLSTAMVHGGELAIDKGIVYGGICIMTKESRFFVGVVRLRFLRKKYVA